MNSTSLFGLQQTGFWSTESACLQLQQQGQASSRRTAERRLHELQMLPPALDEASLRDELGRPPVQLVLRQQLERARSRREHIFFAQIHRLPTGQCSLHFNDARGARFWVVTDDGLGTTLVVVNALELLQRHLAQTLLVLPSGELTGLCRALPEGSAMDLLAFPALPPDTAADPVPLDRTRRTAYLSRLEDESIHILREAVAEAERPVMLYSVGKDSSVMLHLARKAFYPSRPPMPLLHVDTRWKFREMYQQRDLVARTAGVELLVHVNPDAIARDINPFDHGSSLHTDITKTEGLKQVLNAHRFDVVFGGARRDEEKSRAKERVFSFRTPTHAWDPKNQRPELWNLYSARKGPGESIRVFPLSNWTELDIWQYIHQENIPVVPLYFARTRPIVRRDGLLLMVDDDRFRLLPGETIEPLRVRFRTLGCYPLTGAVPSNATSVPDIIVELANARTSERQGRAIDADAAASMEKKKKEGYF